MLWPILFFKAYLLCPNNRTYSVDSQLYLCIFLENFRKEQKDMSLYSAIKIVANQNGKSIYQIEKDLKLSNGLISKWNKSVPRADSLQKVADYLGVTTQYLFSLARKE